MKTEGFSDVQGEVKDLYERWNKQFFETGIFEEEILPYHIQIKPLLAKDLKDIGSDDSGVIFYQFLEILRHNVVSDKANAFNKIFNLFLCKIYDEDKNEEEELEFQWKYNDTNESLLGRLNTLFKKGMKKFLDKKITDYSEKDIEKEVSSLKVQNILKELRLYKNQEFAFLEVYDEESFNENAEIVREVVELLQPYRIRYNNKQQFLGNFFERLLNTGFKQERGQYFTPIPLTRFILNSLPIEEFIQEKIQRSEDDFLPYVIDYACGSGHFLTEAMDLLQEKISTLELSYMRPFQKKNLEKYRASKYDWAEKYIYGIEKDYRLVKTTKLSCFLNGDGLANIIHASGLASFDSKEYKGKEKLQKPEQFDILVANPPYSVKGFLKTVKEGRDSFELLRKGKITDKSSAIELLFVERMCQLIKPKGYSAIILPSSFLTNNDEATQLARNLLLSHFEIQAVSLFGNNAFMATGTNTIVLFLKKRSERILLSPIKEDYQALFKNQEILVIVSGEKEKEKDFLGYEFSNAKDAKEPIKIWDSLMTNPKDQKDSTKASYYIYQWILTHEKLPIPEDLEEHLYYKNLETCFNFDQETFSNSLNVKKKISLQSKWDLVALGSIKYIKSIGSGTTAPQRREYFKNGKYSFVRAKDLNKKNGNYIEISLVDKLTETAVIYSKLKKVSENAIIFPKSGQSINTNNIALLPESCFLVNHLAYIETNNSSFNSYLFYFLREYQISNLVDNKSDYPSINESLIKSLLIPLPPKEKQDQIVSLMEEQENIIKVAEEEIKKIEETIQAIDFSKFPEIPLNKVVNFIMGERITKSNNKGSLYPVYGGGGASFRTDNYNRENSIIISRFAMSEDCVRFIPSKFWLLDSAISMDIKDNIKTKYLFYYLKKTENIIYSYGRGPIQKNLEINLLKVHPIKLPPLQEQEKIVSYIEEQELLISQAKEKIEQAQGKQKQIMSEVFQLVEES